MSKAWSALPASCPACCARLTVLSFFRGLQALQLGWETVYQVEKTCSSIFMSLESASRCLLLSCVLKSTQSPQTKQLPWSWQCLFSAAQPTLKLISSCGVQEKLIDKQGKWGKIVLQLDYYLGLGKPAFNSPSAPGSLEGHHAASMYLHPCLSHGG